MSKKTIFYLRTDISYTPLVAGGSVGHTLGVIQGFIGHGYDVITASTVMIEQLSALPIRVHQLALPKYILSLRTKIVLCYLLCFLLTKRYDV